MIYSTGHLGTTTDCIKKKKKLPKSEAKTPTRMTNSAVAGTDKSWINVVILCSSNDTDICLRVHFHALLGIGLDVCMCGSSVHHPISTA